MSAACGWTLIRKTSLLRKINPMMRRSSFTKKDIYKPDHPSHLSMSCDERAPKCPGDYDCDARIASQIPNSDQSPLYDVRNPAVHPVKDNTCEVMFRGRYSKAPLSRAVSSIFKTIWWSQTGSNRRPHACKARALPAELWPRTRRRMSLR